MFTYGTNKIPDWLGKGAQRMSERSEAYSKMPYEPYKGQRVAGMTPEMLKAQAMAAETGAYMPNLEKAEQFAAKGAQQFPEHYQQYMNPYQQAVIDRIGEEGARNIRERIIPSLEGQFSGLGQYGSTQHQRFLQNAMRDMQGEISARQAQALAGGYQQAGQLFNADRERSAQAANQFGDLGRFRQAGKFSDISGLGMAGEQKRGFEQQNLNQAYEDFMRQQQFPYEQMQRHRETLHGLPRSETAFGGQFSPPPQQWNTWGNIGSLAGNLWGAGRATGGFKAGGMVQAKSAYTKKAKGLGSMNLNQSSFMRQPKVGSKFKMPRRTI